MSNSPFIFKKVNYLLLLAGALIMGLGYILMTGGYTTDPNVFNEAEIYSFRRVTLAPIVILAGLGIVIVSILYRRKEA